MKRLYNFTFLIVIIFSITSCNLFEYAKAIQTESKENFEKHKSYMVNSSFKGVIIKKVYCERCEINKYVLTIRLDSIYKKPSFQEAQFPPYYEFKNDTILDIVVSQSIYDEVEEKNLLLKQKHSHYISVEQLELLYLSKKHEEWTP